MSDGGADSGIIQVKIVLMTKYPVSIEQDFQPRNLTTIQKYSSFISMIPIVGAFFLDVLTITAMLDYWRMLLMQQSVRALPFWKVFRLKENYTS